MQFFFSHDWGTFKSNVKWCKNGWSCLYGTDEEITREDQLAPGLVQAPTYLFTVMFPRIRENNFFFIFLLLPPLTKNKLQLLLFSFLLQICRLAGFPQTWQTQIAQIWICWTCQGSHSVWAPCKPPLHTLLCSHISELYKHVMGNRLQPLFKIKVWTEWAGVSLRWVKQQQW